MLYLSPMPELKDSFNKCLHFSSAALARMLTRSMDEHFGAVELSISQGFILMAIKQAPGISIGDLAYTLVLDQSTVTKTIDKLIAKRMAQREPIGRVVRIFLTEEGEKKEAEAQSAWKKARIAYTKSVGTGEVKHLAHELAKAQTSLT